MTEIPEIDLESEVDESRAQLRALAKPFPANMVQRNPRGASYVGHAMVTQKMLKVIGPHGFEVTEVVRGWIPAHKEKPGQTNAIVACLTTLTAPVDDDIVTITEVGECENPHVHAHDGIRLKMAASDGYKRCAMRLGVGLHLWSKDGYFLDDLLEAEVPAPPARAAEDPKPERTEQEVVETVAEAFEGTVEEAEEESRRRFDAAKEKVANEAATQAPSEPEVETMGDQAQGTPMAALMALGGPQMARAKRALEAKGYWPLLDDWEKYVPADKTEILRIIMNTT